MNHGLTLPVTGGMNLPASAGVTFGRERLFLQIPVPVICLVAVIPVMFFGMKFTGAVMPLGATRGPHSFLVSNDSAVAPELRKPGHGGSLLMEAVTAAVIGGVSLSGGKGGVWGIIWKTVLTGAVSNSLNLTCAPSFRQYIVLAASTA